MRSTRIILHGNEELANQFIRECKVEMYRTEEVAKNAQVTSYQRDTWINNAVLCRTLVTPSENIIHIYATDKAVIKPEEDEEPLEPTEGCPAVLQTYHYEEDFDGYFLGYQGNTWRLGEIADFTNTGNGGWHHYKKDSSVHKVGDSCSLITWDGNPSTLCGDSIHDGLANLLSSRFYASGETIRCPSDVLGACLLTDGTTDWWYVLTTSNSNNNITGGEDNKIYRKNVTAVEHPTDDWELVGTIPFSDISGRVHPSGFNPLAIGTAYIDEDGIAWYSALVERDFSGAWKWYVIQLRVDLRNGTYTITQEPNTLNYSRYSTKTHYWDAASSPTDDWTNTASQTSFATIAGEQYIFTYGGLEARYDVYLRADYLENASFSYLESSVGWVQEDVLTQIASGNKSATVSNTVSLVLYKDDEEIWSGPLTEETWGGSAFYTREYRLNDPAGQPDTDVTSDNPMQRRVKTTLYTYLFLHPHLLNHVVVYKRDGVFAPDTALNEDSGMTHSVLLNGENLAPSFVGTQNITSTDDALYITAGSFFDTIFTEPDEEDIAYNESDSVIEKIAFEPFNIGTLRTPFWYQLEQSTVSWCPIASHRKELEICSSLKQGSAGANPSYQPFFKYDNSCEAVQSTRLYKPDYAVTLKGEIAVACLQQVFAGTPTNTTVNNTVSQFLNPTVSIATNFEPVINADDLDLETTLYWVTSHSGSAWNLSQAYKAKEMIWYKQPDGAVILLDCKLDHTATEEDQPFTGESWTTYWDFRPSNTFVVSNVVLTQTQIQLLCNEQSSWVLEFGVI